MLLRLRIAKTDAWIKALEACKDYDLGDHRGDEWKKKKDLLKAYGRLQDRSTPVVYNHYKESRALFKETKMSGTPYVRWIGDGL